MHVAAIAVPPLAALLAAAVTTALPAQDAPRLVRVPEQVRLPAPGGNLLLEVETAADAKAVWIAVDGAATDRVKLIAAGDGRWQINLAVPAVADLLPANRDHGELFVFARAGEGVARSAPIGWSRAAANAPAGVRCLVRLRGEPTRRLAPGDEIWLDLARLERLEIEGAGARQSTAVARLAEVDLPLQRDAAAGTWTFAPTPSLRERLGDGAAFEVELRLGAVTEAFRFRCVPTALHLPEGLAEFDVAQRRRAFVPGSRDWLQVRIDDITAGQVRLELVQADGRAVAPARLVHERDHVAFALGDERYVLVVKRLVNVLLGDDHATFVVQPAAAHEPDRIALLLRAVADSDATFLREGVEHDGAAAARFLRAKLAGHRGAAPSVADFVDRIASRSSRSGDPYHVRSTDGDVVTMQQWLHDELRRIETRLARPQGR